MERRPWRHFQCTEQNCTTADTKTGRKKTSPFAARCMFLWVHRVLAVGKPCGRLVVTLRWLARFPSSRLASCTYSPGRTVVCHPLCTTPTLSHSSARHFYCKNVCGTPLWLYAMKVSRASTRYIRNKIECKSRGEPWILVPIRPLGELCDLGQATWHPKASLSDLFIKEWTAGMAEVSYGVPALFPSINFPKSRSEWILRHSSRWVEKEGYLQPVVSSNASKERKEGGGRLAEGPAPRTRWLSKFSWTWGRQCYQFGQLGNELCLYFLGDWRSLSVGIITIIIMLVCLMGVLREFDIHINKAFRTH